MAISNTPIITGNIDQPTIRRVYRLLTTFQGEVPFDRLFGIDPSSLDNVPRATEGALLVEYTKKMKMYYPTLTITSLTFSYQGTSVVPQVVINNNG
jgi:hypothetical protein